MRPCYKLFLLLLLLVSIKAYSQQDVDFHLNAHLLTGKKILKVKRDFYDPYLWVLAQNNEVYRVNSLTLAVEDYTPQFSAYRDLHFNDIAGRSKDTVLISANVIGFIHFKNGTIKFVGTADGIIDTVNSVGIAGGATEFGSRTAAVAMVASNNGFFLYDQDKGTLTNEVNTSNFAGAYSKVYQATYRMQMFRDSASFSKSASDGYKGIYYQPVTFFPSSAEIVTGYLWEGAKPFGYGINTAETINQTIYAFNPVFSAFFWGNKNGLFQVNFYQDNAVFSGPYTQYLKGINVTKIENIYGLTAFGDGGGSNEELIKQTLLIGTGNGLYFTSSIYQQTLFGLKLFSTYHYDELGNIPINDICVNAVSINAPICEDGAWIATNQGLYFLKADYGKYFKTSNYNAINFKGQPNTISETDVCAGESVTGELNHGAYSSNVIQWYKDGIELPGQSKDNLVIKTAGDYYALLYDPCQAVQVETNHLKVNVISGPVFSFNYPDKIPECGTDPYTLKTDDNPDYTYRWYTNGMLNGTTTSSFVVTQSGKYKVEVSACTNSWVPSKEVEVDMITPPAPVISPDKTTYCAEDIATLSVNPVPDDTFTINWYLNSNLISAAKNLTSIMAGTPGSYTVTVSSNLAACQATSTAYQLSFVPPPIFTSNFPDEARACTTGRLSIAFTGQADYHFRWYTNGVLNGDTTDTFVADKSGRYKVEVSTCAGSWLPSNEIQLDLVNLPVPAITTDKAAYCIGDNATLSISAPADPSYTINWYRDGTSLADNNNRTSLTTGLPGDYSVTLINNLQNYDGSTCSEASAKQTVTFNPKPAISIEKIVKTSLCDGQTADLKADFTGGSILWSTGETTAQISTGVSGTYKATVTSPAGCTADTSITLQFLPNPVLNLKDTSLCAYTKQTVTLTAPPGFAAYSWNNGVSTEQTFLVSQPQTVTLTVTDANGCQATQQVVVAPVCADVYIPNTFTPNNDGVNDFWDIGGLQDDATAIVRIYTRYGSLIYESKGYGTPWNGQYKGKKLPAGVYYYLINAKNNKQKFSGALTILY